MYQLLISNPNLESDIYFLSNSYIPELYEYCIKEGIADKNLIAKWKKQGYENLCCLRCIQARDTNFGTNCICRVPKAKLEEVIYESKVLRPSRNRHSLIKFYILRHVIIFFYLSLFTLGRQSEMYQGSCGSLKKS